MMPVLKKAYWTPPANIRKAKKEAEKALDFFADLSSVLNDKKLNDGMYEVFKTSFSDTFSYSLSNLTEYNSSDRFNESHQLADTYFQLNRWLGVDTNLEKIETIRRKLDEFYQTSLQEEFYDNTSDAWRSIDLSKPLSQRDIRILSKNMWDSEEYGSFEKVALPVIRGVELLPRHLKAYEDYLKSVKYKVSSIRKKQESGQGEPRPDVEDLEIVWHTTTAYSSIIRDGFKTREQLGGEAAGLGGAVSGISFTAQLDLAKDIEAALNDAVEIMQGPNTLDAILEWASQFGIKPDELKRDGKWSYYGIVNDDELAEYLKDHTDQAKYFSPPNKLKLSSMWELFQWALVLIEQKGIRVNPVFFGVNPESFTKINQSDIGIVEAIIDTTDPDIDYRQSMEEWRVPTKSILSYGPIGSQQNILRKYEEVRGEVIASPFTFEEVHQAYRNKYLKPTRSDRIPIARLEDEQGGPNGGLLEKDSKGRYYLNGERIDHGKGTHLQWTAKWVYRGDKLVRVGSYEDVGWTDSLSAKKETRRIEDLAGFVSDIIEFENPHPLTKAEYRRLDPIILDDRGDLLDGYHRLAGLVVGGETGNIPVIVVYDEDLASDLSEPGYLQDKALEALKEIL